MSPSPAAAAAVPSPLEELARAWGVETSYRDVDDRTQTASVESLLAVLRALGAPVNRVADAPDALAARRERRARDPVEPVVVAAPDEPAAIPWRERVEAGAAAIEAQLETGETRAWTVPVGTPDPGRIVLPEPLPVGAHDLTVTLGSRRAATTLLVAPAVAPPPADARGWGVFAPLYALQHAPGAPPAFPDLDRLARWAGERGASTVATLPLLAAFLDEPVDVSPYAPMSRQLWNEAFVDLRLLPELDGDGAALPEPGDGPLVDLAAVMAAKRPALETAARRVLDRPGDRSAALRRFLADHPEVRAHARFRAARERHDPDWRTWPAAWRGAGIPDAAVDDHVCRYHEYVQWVADEQLGAVTGALAERGQQLYLDFPVGTHPLGFDVWSEPAGFAPGVTVGAPPDAFFARGQNWGFPPLHPEATRPGGHAHLRACLRHHFRHAGRLRIDHVMGLHRLYWIPEGAAATDGVYVRSPARELYAALLLEAARAGSRVVGENLGTVPEEVQDELERRQLATMYVVEFELDPAHPNVLRPPPPRSVATLDTHDTPTFAAFWAGADPGQQAALADVLAGRGRLARSDAADPAAVLGALVEELGASDAELVLVALEDLWLEPAPQNVPGTTTEHPNWARRAAHRLDELPFLTEVGRVLDRLDASRRAPVGRTAARC